MNKEKKYRANFTNSKVQHESSEYLSINGRKDGRCRVAFYIHNTTMAIINALVLINLLLYLFQSPVQ